MMGLPKVVHIHLHIVSVVLLLTLSSIDHEYSATEAQRSVERYATGKTLSFTDPNTKHLYQVVSHNVKTMAANLTFRSFIQVARMTVNDPNLRKPASKPEIVQTIIFNPTLVDFELLCSPTFCYMVAVTSKSKRNVELYAWQRTQFDLLTKRDSFAKPRDVAMFVINDEFYVVIAQQQLHLTQFKISRSPEGSTRLIGNAILKFTKGNEDKVKYHQFIRLPYHPEHVSYLSAANAPTALAKQTLNTEDHYLVFSNDPNWNKSKLPQGYTFFFSPLDGYFWPFKLPRGSSLQPDPSPVSPGYRIQFPPEPVRNSLNQQIDYTEATETCFHHLQRLLSERDLQSRHLIKSGQSIWRHPNEHAISGVPLNKLTNISSQVIVHGDVTVFGSMIESPQVSLLGAQHLPPVTQLAPTPVIDKKALSSFMKSLSPESVDSKLRHAQYKIKNIRDKLAQAVFANQPNNTVAMFNSQVRLYGNVQAKEVILRGVANSDVHLNAIPFKQLEHELVSLSGKQVITPQVRFTGQVVADLLEIHGIINGKYRLKDAIDITSRFPQILEAPTHLMSGGSLEFYLMETPEIRMLQNVTINGIHLNDFITRDNRTQLIYGQKIFKRLTMDRLDLANQGVLLNELNLDEISKNAIHLRDPMNARRLISGNHVNFQRPVHANKVLVNNVINQHINTSLIIQDSIKTQDTSIQQISGSKNFLNGLRINRLITQGSLNGIKVDDVFNLNSDAQSFHHGHGEQLISGFYRLHLPIEIRGNLISTTLNGIDISLAAVRRALPETGSRPEIIRGHKTFYRPLRILDNVTLLDAQQIGLLAESNISASYPLINDYDLKQISSALSRQMKTPSMIFIDDLEIEGNVDLQSHTNSSLPPKATFGNFTVCPLDAIKTKLVTAGIEDQILDIPIRIDTLRAKSVQLDPGALNGMSFPQDFVLRSGSDLEPVHGIKVFDELAIYPSPSHPSASVDHWSARSIWLGIGTSVNNLNYHGIQTFVQHELKNNSTGEQVFNTIDVLGNIYTKRINGQSWPDDILLKSLGTVSGPPESPYVHNRIYSPLVFLNSSLEVDGQLVLRGPIKLHGKLNGLNLTEFSRQSATFGDKDLFYNGRPLRNKLFLGGLTVRGELRAQGLIDSVNIEDMRRRVVTIGPRGKRIIIYAPKMFMSDTITRAHVNMPYIDDIPVDKYLSHMQLLPDGEIRIRGKKTITGALRIYRDLYVDGLINGFDYAKLRSQAIPLSPAQGKLKFNKTLTVEGDVFLDNLLIDEKNGTIDGVRLADLARVQNGPVPVQLQTVRLGEVDDQINRIPELQATSVPPYHYAMVARQPISIQYERGRPIVEHQSHLARYPRSALHSDQISLLRSQLIPLTFLNFSPRNHIVIGFVDASYQSLAGYQLPMSGPLHSDHLTDDLRSFTVLDQVDFAYKPITYHLSAVVSRGPNNKNSTSVQSSIGGRPHELLTMLPVEHPNSAIFINDEHYHALFLLLSQDYTVKLGRNFVCPISDQISQIAHRQSLESSQVEGNIHVYLFHVLQNSSSLKSGYFDLYQTVDLPEIDSFAKFQYNGSVYALAVSRAMHRVYLMILRGFVGFQMVSHIDTPMVDHVEVVLANDEKPAIVIYQTNGSYRIMKSIII